MTPAPTLVTTASLRPMYLALKQILPALEERFCGDAVDLFAMPDDERIDGAGGLTFGMLKAANLALRIAEGRP